MEFLYRKNKHQIGNITLDALLQQEIVLDSVVTSRPLETGELYNDAIHNEPLRVYVTGIVTDSAQTEEENKPFSFTDTQRIESSKALTAWRELYKLWKQKVLITVTTPLQAEPFKNMAILRIVPIQDNTDSLTFKMDLQQVLLGAELKKRQLHADVGKQSVRDA